MAQNYPHIQFRERWDLTNKTFYELGQCSAIILAIANVPITPDQHAGLLNISLTKGARATTAIEGNTLTEEEVDAIREGTSSLPPSKEYQEREVRNILDALNTVFKEVAFDGKQELLTPDILKSFHREIGKDLGEHFDAIPGRFREDSRFVGTYKCPDWRDVPDLVTKLCDWLKEQFHFQQGQSFADAVIQAIITHVYIEWIHPFGDGNGRTGRLVEFYFLLRAGTPDIASHILSNHYNETRPEYYRQLDRATKTRDLGEFIAYAVQGFRDGLLKILEAVQGGQFVTSWRQYVYSKFSERKTDVANRQRDLALAMPLKEWQSEDQIGALNINIARTYGQLSSRTLERDLLALKEMGIVLTRPDGHFRTNCDQLLNQTARRAQRKMLHIDEVTRMVAEEAPSSQLELPKPNY